MIDFIATIDRAAGASGVDRSSPRRQTSHWQFDHFGFIAEIVEDHLPPAAMRLRVADHQIELLAWRAPCSSCDTVADRHWDCSSPILSMKNSCV